MRQLRRILATALAAALLDLIVAFLFWAHRGVMPDAVLDAMAGWILGPHARTAATLLLGAGVHLCIYLLLVFGFVFFAGRSAGSGRLRGPLGALYGIAGYLVVFHLAVPLLIWPRHLAAPSEWVLVCLLTHGLLIGPAIAYLSMPGTTRQALGRRAMTAQRLAASTPTRRGKG